MYCMSPLLSPPDASGEASRTRMLSGATLSIIPAVGAVGRATGSCIHCRHPRQAATALPLRSAGAGGLSVRPVTVPWSSWRTSEVRSSRVGPAGRQPTRTLAVPIQPTRTLAVPIQPTRTSAVPIQPTRTSAVPIQPCPIKTPSLRRKGPASVQQLDEAVGHRRGDHRHCPRTAKALEAEKPAVPFVIEASEPDDPDGLIDLRFDPDSPSGTVAIIRRSVADDGLDTPSGSMPLEPGAQADRHLPRRTVDDQHDADTVGQAGGGVGGKVPLEHDDGESHP